MANTRKSTIVYREPESYIPKEFRKVHEKTTAKKTTVKKSTSTKKK